MARTIVSGCYLLVLIAQLAALVGHSLDLPIPNAAAIFPVLIVLAMGVLVLALREELPMQNVLMTLTLLYGGYGFFQLLNYCTNVPFAAQANYPRFGPNFAWFLPLIWSVALLSCRGVARLAMGPMRSHPRYGFLVLGLTLVLALLFNLGLEPFASTVMGGAWTWSPSVPNAGWYATPWLTLLGWTAASALVLFLSTPAMIAKHPIAHPPGFTSFWIWLSFKVCLIAGAASQKLWPVAAVALGEAILLSSVIVPRRQIAN